ncbi:uncharacterized protein LOC121592533 isoform X2 [Anopheles merus]|uniref:uncharacterized protein LOC121592533 isoform X2 n=1 Tax=Anopheles merus TaxID=30066 RepID=UPI001BE4D4CA|nr:uncharacterized protein LOC121592533 isoform X2 [Anopheles merus]XP_041769997.1 uncharacterized protein LOC121592533 isoform X2 [Anopheles merus]XP_041769998.1 uncharacterized protein LOC121592533 isoform X2 [Anopheles merus]XP_041769999.1 uncharacterized protein LOC121592533 isoform X2 [Anopheles merus]
MTIGKVLCVLIASVNLVAMAYTVYSIMHYLDEQPLLEIFISPCLANMVLAVLLVIGIATQEISLIRLFKIFLYAQLVFALLMVVYGHRFFETVKLPVMVKAYFSIMFLVCAVELVIVSSTIENLRKRLNPAEGLVVYMPVGQPA